VECVYNLMTFGIPREAIPVGYDGDMDLSNHHKTLQSLQYREENQVVPPASGRTLEPKRENDCVLVPGPMDMRMGRGRHPKTCTGALRLNNLLVKHRDAYEAAPKREKTEIAEIVLQEMKKSGCRFLTLTSGGFMVSDDTAVRKKISQNFRNLRMKNTNDGGTKAKKRNLLET
jgi:hypothetical protein